MTDATEIARYLVEDLRLTIGRRRSPEEMTDAIVQACADRFGHVDDETMLRALAITKELMEADLAYRDGLEE